MGKLGISPDFWLEEIDISPVSNLLVFFESVDLSSSKNCVSSAFVGVVIWEKSLNVHCPMPWEMKVWNLTWFVDFPKIKCAFCRLFFFGWSISRIRFFLVKKKILLVGGCFLFLLCDDGVAAWLLVCLAASCLCARLLDCFTGDCSPSCKVEWWLEKLFVLHSLGYICSNISILKILIFYNYFSWEFL